MTCRKTDERPGMIRVEEVSKTYDGRTVLHPTTLAVERERTLALIGPSGCGKSTLLRVMAGLIAPDTGRVTVGEAEMTPSTARALRRRMGYVIQEGGLFPHLTAEGNALLMAEHTGMPPVQRKDRLRELADLVHFAPELLSRYPAQLSGGQRQRVGLIRALMLDPDVLLLDEPLGALDPLIRASLQAELREIFRRLRKAVVLVTHDMGEAAYLGGRIAVMREGRILQQGTARELVHEPASPFVREFIQAQRPLWIDEAMAPA